MKLAVLYFRTLFSGKIKVLTIGFVLSLIASLILNATSAKVASEVFGDIGISFLAAALVAAFEEIKGDKIVRLMKMFCIKNDKKIAIVIAEFSNGYIIPNPEKADQKVDLSEIPSVSKVDTEAASDFVALFRSFNQRMPELITDQRALEIISNDNEAKEYCCFVSVGLSSNKFSRRIATEYLEKNVLVFQNDFMNNQGDKKIQIKESNGQFRATTPNILEVSDLALITKLKCQTNSKNHSFEVLMTGGLNATGTNKIGKFIYENWNEIAEECFDNNKKVIETENCFLLCKVKGEMNVRFDPNAVLEKAPIRIRQF